MPSRLSDARVFLSGGIVVSRLFCISVPVYLVEFFFGLLLLPSVLGVNPRAGAAWPSGWLWSTAGGTFASTRRVCRAELCKAVVLVHGALCGKAFACTRATDEHAPAAADSRGRGGLTRGGRSRQARSC